MMITLQNEVRCYRAVEFRDSSGANLYCNGDFDMGCPCNKKPEYVNPGPDGRPRYAISDPSFSSVLESSYRAGFEIGNRRMKRYID